MCKSRTPKQHYPTGGTYEDAFWRAFLGDIVQWEFPERRAIDEDSNEVSKYRQGIDGVSRPILTSLQDMTIHRAFFLTKMGYTGIGQSGQLKVLRGDEIWILSGGLVPFILRQRNYHVQEDSGRMLVGYACVHGIMDGEKADFQGPAAWTVCLH